MKKKVILSAIMSIALCISLIAGATFAIFTSESSVNIAVTSGKVKVVAEVSDFKAYSPASISTEEGNAILDATDKAVNEGDDAAVKYFANGGTAQLTVNDGAADISLKNMTPGDKVSFKITVKNYSNVKIQYRTSVKDETELAEGEVALFGGLEFSVGGKSVAGESVWQVLAAATDAENGDNVAEYECTVALPATAGNEYQGAKCNLRYVVEAVQGNAKTSNVTTVIDAPVEGEKNPVTAAIEEAKKDSTNTSLTMEVPTGVTASLESGVMETNTSALKTIAFVGELNENGEPTSTVDIITDSQNAEGGNLSYQRGLDSISFKNMEIKAGTGNFDGIVCKRLVYENCVIKGKLTFYADAVVDMINCVFENDDMENQYSIWTWGASKITLEGCTFNTTGKAVLLYGQRTAANPTDLIVNNCVFNDNKNGAAGKAAIEIGNDYGATYSLTIDENTTKNINGFADGKYTGSKVWANKNKMDAAHLTVTIAGISQYSSLEDAFGLAAGSFGVNSTLAAGTVLDGKGKVNIYFWIDGYVANNLTIKGVTFANGATFNVKNSNVKFSIEDCTFYACDQDKAAVMLDIDNSKTPNGNNGRNNILTNSGAGMCLNLEQSNNTTGVELVVKGCEFIGENDKTLSAYGDKYNGQAEVIGEKKRGHAIALNAISGGGTAGTLKSLLIDNCVMGGLRGNAIQLYGSTGDITIKDTKINSWAVNDTNIGYAIRGDYEENGNRKLTLTNVYYGLDEINGNKEFGHVYVGEFAGNTDGTRVAGTY